MNQDVQAVIAHEVERLIADIRRLEQARKDAKAELGRIDVDLERLNSHRLGLTSWLETNARSEVES